jgi:extracellular factor (EF) 3-hydroxypalmitic acid methyl ester biosynthesis protein
LIRRSMQNQNVPFPDRFRILSVACGPAVEIGDLLGTPEECARVHFSLLDQDPHALLEAGGLIKQKEDSLRVTISTDLIRESVRTMLVTEQLKDRWGLFHFIYSMGLFDYLTTPVATAVLKKLYNLLRPCGEMVIGNMHSGNRSKYFMAYWHDWKIIHRSEDDLLRLAQDLPGATLGLKFDDSRIQMMLCVRKLEENK